MISVPADDSPATGTTTEAPQLSRTVFWFLVLFALCVSMVLRGFALWNTTLLDDHDSIFYIQSIEAYQSLQWSQIDALNSDSTPTYPFLASMVAHITTSPELAGRVVSLLSSALLLCMVALIGARLHSRAAGVLAALILAVSPLEIFLSVAVLTEVLYQALIYSGMFLVLRALQARRFTLASAVLAAAVYGLSFLTKTEGILFIVLCPLVIVAGMVTHRVQTPATDGTSLFPVVWIVGFVLIFLIVATIQILHVSKKMGSPALNGRVAWQSLVALLPDRPLDSAIYGLDLDESSTNIVFARRNYPETVKSLSGQANNQFESNRLIERIKISLKNVDTIYRHVIGDLLSPLGVFFLFSGVLVVLVQGSLASISFFLFVLAGVLVAPILHTSVIPRQMAQAIPIFSILQAIGVLATSGFIFYRKHSRARYVLITSFVLGALIAGQAVPIFKALHPPTFNAEYDPAIIAEPVDIIKANPKITSIAARKAYLAFLSGIEAIPVPFTDLEGLVAYLTLNDTDHMYIDFDLLKQFPFMESLSTPEYERNFVELWSHSVDGRTRAALYRLRQE